MCWQIDVDFCHVLTMRLVCAALDPSVWPLLDIWKAIRANRVSWEGSYMCSEKRIRVLGALC
jgi:hypothetical protein